MLATQGTKFERKFCKAESGRYGTEKTSSVEERIHIPKITSGKGSGSLRGQTKSAGGLARRKAASN